MGQCSEGTMLTVKTDLKYNFFIVLNRLIFLLEQLNALEFHFFAPVSMIKMFSTQGYHYQQRILDQSNVDVLVSNILGDMHIIASVREPDEPLIDISLFTETIKYKPCGHTGRT